MHNMHKHYVQYAVDEAAARIMFDVISRFYEEGFSLRHRVKMAEAWRTWTYLFYKHATRYTWKQCKVQIYVIRSTHSTSMHHESYTTVPTC